MADDDETKPNTKASAGPLDSVAAATAVGFAVATEAMSMWFGVMAGVARASQEMLERNNLKRADEQPAYAPEAKSAETAAKAAARTVFAEIERTTRTVTDATAAIINKQVKAAEEATKPVPTAPRPTAGKPQPATIIPIKSKAAKPVSASAPAKGATEQVVAAARKQMPAVQADAAVSAAAAPAAPVQAKAPMPKTTGIMPEDFRAPKAIAKPAIPDDFKQLAGLGPKLEQVLNGLGVWTFEQIAAWTPQEIAYVEDITGLNGRITQDKWLEQAHGLAKGATKH